MDLIDEWIERPPIVELGFDEFYRNLFGVGLCNGKYLFQKFPEDRTTKRLASSGKVESSSTVGRGT